MEIMPPDTGNKDPQTGTLIRLRGLYPSLKTALRKVADVIGEITSASAEQSAGIDHVNQAIANLDQMTQQNAALVEESAAAAESLRDQADQMAQAVSVFKTTGSAPAGSRRPGAPLPYQRTQPLALR